MIGAYAFTANDWMELDYPLSPMVLTIPSLSWHQSLPVYPWISWSYMLHVDRNPQCYSSIIHAEPMNKAFHMQSD